MSQLDSTNNSKLPLAALTALGVVYGDIGTSPLYAFRECFQYMQPTPVNVYGILSLIVWSLIIVISVKYAIFIMRADKDGEGGILVLLNLLNPRNYKPFIYFILFAVGIAGACLLYGDGMLTPAISVLSAVEGISVISPNFSHIILPFTVFILFLLFLSQRTGTFRIGVTFGPIMLSWFVIIGLLGLVNIFKAPSVLNALNPIYAFEFFKFHGYAGYLVLGGVFLAVTGGEALYADMGHFGKIPIRVAWFCVVLPALLLNYFGQGANVLADPYALQNPFYNLAPHWFIIPLLVFATIATIIASQAIISAVFSLTSQAVLMRLFPKVKIVQTSSTEKGQIYVPSMNWILAIGTIILVLHFGSSSNLANAYGIAVNMVMLATTVLVFFVSYHNWRWSLTASMLLTSSFFVIDAAFLGANLHKIIAGGWFPVLFGVIGFTIMYTWHRGLEQLSLYNQEANLSIDIFFSHLMRESIPRIPGTAVFITENQDEKGGSLLHHLKLNQMLHEQVVVLSIIINDKPMIALENRVVVQEKGAGFYRMWLHYGFMQTIDIPNTLRLCKELNMIPFLEEVEQIVYYMETIKIAINPNNKRMWHWCKRLFTFMLQNVSHEAEFYQLPVNRTIAIGSYYEI